MEKDEYQRMYSLENDFWWYRILHELVEAKIRKISSGGTMRILDAGCGTGRMMEILQKHGPVSGLDFSEEAVTLARKRGAGTVVRGDLNTYNFQKDYLDAVVCLDVLYHSGIKDDQAVIGKFYDTLKSGGTLIINLPAFEFLRRGHDTVVHTRKRYRRKEFVSQLKKAGFTVNTATYRLPLLFLVIMLSGIIKKPDRNMKKASDLKKLPRLFNAVLLCMGRWENRLTGAGICFPFGSSLFVVAQKNQA